MSADDTPIPPEQEASEAPETPETTEASGNSEGSQSLGDDITPAVSRGPFEKHYSIVSALLTEKERLALAYVDQGIPKPYFEEWVEESNRIFGLVVRMKHRRSAWVALDPDWQPPPPDEDETGSADPPSGEGQSEASPSEEEVKTPETAEDGAA